MSKQIINIENLDRVDMFKKFMNYPQPIGSATATLNINKLMKFKKRGHKLNSLINYCILKACYRIKEFHYLYEKNTLYYCDKISMLGVVKGKDEKLYLSTWNYYDNYIDFENNYKDTNKKVHDTNKSIVTSDGAMVSSSTVIQFPFDNLIINMGEDIKHSYFTWGAYKKKFIKYEQPITIRFHHAFFDGEQIGLFFKYLQEEIKNFKIK